MLIWRMLRIIPRLEYLDRTIPRLEALEGVLPKLEALEAFHTRLEALSQVLGTLETIVERLPIVQETLTLAVKLEETAVRMPSSESISQMSEKLGSLDQAVAKIERFSQPAAMPVMVHAEKSNGKNLIDRSVMEDRHGWNRMKMLAKFTQLADQAKEIEKEWQKIQQDEHDASFAYETLGGDYEKSVYIYKKGIADGVKWCINRFS